MMSSIEMTGAEQFKLKETRSKDYQTLSPSKKARPDSERQPGAADKQHVEIHIEENSNEGVRKKVPRRVVHCSDGVFEEYSTDEEEKEEKRKKESRQEALNSVNPKELSWVPWMVHYSWLGGSNILYYCDAVGEKLAWFFGITSPKYYYEIQEFKRMQKLEQEQKAKVDAEIKGWQEPSNQEADASQHPVVQDPGKSVSSDETNQ